MLCVIDYSQSLHVYHYETYDSKYEEWRQNLKVGDRIEALKSEGKLKWWGVAIISFIHADILELKFENDSTAYDWSEHRLSLRLAQLGQNCIDYTWKEELKIGDEIDAYDWSKVWYHSTIIGFQEQIQPNGRSWTMVHVGLRYYVPDGK